MKWLAQPQSPNSFLSDSLVSFASNIIARLFTLLAIIVITRVYPAHDFGVWVLLLAVANFFLPFCTLRLELALVLAPTKRLAQGLLLAVCVFTLSLGLVAALLLLLVPRDQIMKVFTVNQSDLTMLALISPLLVIMATQNILQMWLTRTSQFKTIGFATVVHAALTAIMVITLPLFVSANTITIVAASIAGYFASIAILLLATKSDLYRTGAISHPVATAIAAVKRFSIYPKFVFPQSISIIFTERVVQFLLAGLFSVSLLGVYFVARQSLLGPASILAASVRNVIFAHGARDQLMSITRQRTRQMLNILLFFIAPTLAWGVFWIGKLAVLVFGTQWPELPLLCWYCMFPAATLVFSGPLDRLFDLSGYQRLSVAIQIVNDILTVLVALLAVYVGATGIQLVAIISFATVIYNGVWLTLALRSVGFSVAEVGFFLGRFLALFLSCLVLQYLVTFLPNSFVSFLGSIVVLTGTVLYGAYRLAHQFGFVKPPLGTNGLFTRDES
jgi:O-antigen/teichoic acid export membrane protein